MAEMATTNKVTLIGAGLAGPLLAIYLARRGLPVEIYERRPDLRRTKPEAGRSINLALSVRGFHALREVGMYDAIMKIATPMRGRMMHARDGELTFQPYGKDESEMIYSVSRANLNIALMNEAERYPNVAFHFNMRCTGMDFKTSEVKFRHQISGAESLLSAQPVIAVDGSASAIRLDMMRWRRFNYSQYYIEHGYKELTIPAGPNGDYLMDKNALHIWPRGTYMLIALPNIDGSFTCIFFFPFEGEPSFASLTNEEKVAAFFRQQFGDVVPLMPNLAPEFFSNPTGAMVTIKCEPWHVMGKMALLGDAAHAIVPFFGQGVNCAFEDCSIMNECLAKYGADWERVFDEYENLRKVNSDAIADLALENFLEMRDLVADERFLFRKKVEQSLEQRYPEIFIPKYSMVTFHRIPYSVALTRGKIQDEILAELCGQAGDLHALDWQRADRLVQEKLAPIAKT